MHHEVLRKQAFFFSLLTHRYNMKSEGKKVNSQTDGMGNLVNVSLALLLNCTEREEKIMRYFKVLFMCVHVHVHTSVYVCLHIY